jgi:hypothetical protein
VTETHPPDAPKQFSILAFLLSPGARTVLVALISSGLGAIGTYGVAMRHSEVEMRRLDMENRVTEAEIWRGLDEPLYIELERANLKIEQLSTDREGLINQLNRLEREVRQLRRECSIPSPTSAPASFYLP